MVKCALLNLRRLQCVIKNTEFQLRAQPQVCVGGSGGHGGITTSAAAGAFYLKFSFERDKRTG
jgi:hypothetical protein